MSWFTKTKIVQTVAQPTALELYEQNLTELHRLNQELAKAEREIVQYGKDPRILIIRGPAHWTMHAKVNAMSLCPTLQKLEGARAGILRNRAAALAAHARLKQEIGLASY